MKNYVFILSLLTVVAPLISGCSQTFKENKEQLNCSRVSTTWKDKYRKQETYIPSADDPVKTIHCRLIIWQKDDGSGTWDENNPNDLKRLKAMLDWVNLFWSNTQGSSDSLPNVIPLGYSNIKFEIGLKFYRNTYLYDHGGNLCSNFDTLNKTAVTLDPDNAGYLNIHLVGCACKAGGCTNILGSYRFEDQTILMTSNHGADTDDWDDARNIAHELGHALGLAHLYNGTGPDEEPCNNSNIDFLDDAMTPAGIYGCKPGTGCTHCYNPGGSCDPYVSKTDHCNNNLMGGSIDYKYLSPKQVGRCHRTLALTNVSKYATGYSSTPWIISQNETWDFEIKFYQDIVIESGCTLEVKCIVHLVDDVSIIVKPEATLIVDGGRITNGGSPFPGCNGLWNEIKLIHGKVKLQGEKKKSFHRANIETINGGKIEKCQNGIKQY